MSNNSRHETASGEKPMTRKAALAVLHQFWQEYSYTFSPHLSPEQKSERDALCKDAMTALSVLTRAIHGPCDLLKCYPTLCVLCYLHYAEHFPEVKDEVTEYQTVFCCTSCLEQLRADGVLYEEKNEEGHERACS